MVTRAVEVSDFHTYIEPADALLIQSAWERFVARGVGTEIPRRSTRVILDSPIPAAQMPTIIPPQTHSDPPNPSAAASDFAVQCSLRSFSSAAAQPRECLRS